MEFFFGFIVGFLVMIVFLLIGIFIINQLINRHGTNIINKLENSVSELKTKLNSAQIIFPNQVEEIFNEKNSTLDDLLKEDK